MIKALSSQDLIAKEDDIVDVILKWIAMNGTASKNQVEPLYGRVRLERLKNVARIEELCSTHKCPVSLVQQANRIAFQRLQADVAASSAGFKPYQTHREHAKFFIRDQDSHAGHRNCFYCGGYAMEVWMSGGLELSIRVEHRLENDSQLHTVPELLENESFYLNVSSISAVKGRLTRCAAATSITASD